MSLLNDRDSAAENCPASNQLCTAVAQVLSPKEKDLGGFSVRRALPCIERRQIGPFVFFDHMGPAEFAPGDGINVRAHPHIGIATITYLFSGEIFHKDSLGFATSITPGAINLMVAGKGIVHAEKTRDELRASGQKLEALQLWIALPTDKEDTEPSFTHYAADSLPQTNVDGVAIRVMMGSAYGQTSPVQTFSETLYLEGRMPAGSSLQLPECEERGLYVLHGNVRIGETEFHPHQLVVLDDSTAVEMHAASDVTFALIGGASLGKRHIFWNLVSSDPQKIEQAKQDWRDGKFDPVPGETEFIPLPE